MKFRHCYNAYFRWNAGAFQRKVQGFRAVLPEILALEQSHLALKAMAFKACGFVQYALFKPIIIFQFYTNAGRTKSLPGQGGALVRSSLMLIANFAADPDFVPRSVLCRQLHRVADEGQGRHLLRKLHPEAALGRFRLQQNVPLQILHGRHRHGERLAVRANQLHRVPGGKFIAQAQNGVPCLVAACLLYTSPSPRD